MSWTNQNQAEFARLIVVTARLYDKEVGADMAKLIVEDLQDLPFVPCFEALVAFRRNPKNKTWPRASDIRAIVQPTTDDASEALDASARIITAISKFGYTNGEKAREFVGELGWAVIMKQGGWAHLCETITDFNASIHQAQFRELAKAQLVRKRAGLADVPPALSEPSRVPVLDHNSKPETIRRAFIDVNKITGRK